MVSTSGSDAWSSIKQQAVDGGAKSSIGAVRHENARAKLSSREKGMYSTRGGDGGIERSGSRGGQVATPSSSSGSRSSLFARGRTNSETVKR